LAKVIVSKSNFLLLDEPTNHLDMVSVDLLANALNKYEGSFITVSHDRYFISKTANKIWEIEDGLIKEFKGNYAEWVEWKERMAVNAKQQIQEQKPIEVKEEKKAATQPANNSPKDKTQEKEISKLKKQLEKIESELTELNFKKTSIENDLGSPDVYSNKDKFVTLEKNYEQVKEALAKANSLYENVFEQLLELEN
jgi:ATP-binding cassette subfamily F protein 3